MGVKCPIFSPFSWNLIFIEYYFVVGLDKRSYCSVPITWTDSSWSIFWWTHSLHSIQYIVTEKEVEKIFFIILILSLFLVLTLGLPQSFTLHTYTQYIYTNHRVRNSSFFSKTTKIWVGVENCTSTICSKTIKFKSILTDVLAKVTLYSFNLFAY